MAIDSECNESTVKYPSNEFKENAHVSTMEMYKKMYKSSIENPSGFWSSISKEFYFKKQPNDQFYKYNFDVTKGPIEIKWLEGAITNISYNVLDRIVDKGLGDRIAYIW